MRIIRFCTRWRLLRFLLALLLLVSLTATYIYLKNRPSYALYRALDLAEIALSHDLIRQTSGKRYVLFKQLRGAGFNNQAQEILLYHHLALLTSRVYVYQPIVWRARGEQSIVPLSAFLRGPTQGTVSVALFEQVCPNHQVTHVKLGEGVHQQDIWNHARGILGRDDKCIMVDDWILNWNFLASDGLHSIWPSFQTYLSRYFIWSDPVLQIARRSHSKLGLRSSPGSSDGDAYMAIHLRRGDFENHCYSLANSQTGFTTWATLPILKPSIFPPARNPQNQSSTIEHCYPTLARILEVIDVQARVNPSIRTLHILHDGAWDHPLVYIQQYQLESALKSPTRALAVGWTGGPMRRITHSGMLPLNWGEADWAVAVDVELARRAGVFIGNGFSSLSTQVLALRLGADGGKSEDITLL